MDIAVFFQLLHIMNHIIPVILIINGLRCWWPDPSLIKFSFTFLKRCGLVLFMHIYVCMCKGCMHVYVCIYINIWLNGVFYFASFGLDNLFINNPLCFLFGRMCYYKCEQLNLNLIFCSVSVTVVLSCPLRAVLPCMECWILPQRASRWVWWVSQRRVVCLLLSNVFVFFLEFSIINIKMWCTC